ncbi:MAG: hypothetical protein IKZ07_08210 [Akkermansia sp.]|nr:hypothetical protein [Akkermansia sp.]
MFNPPHIEIPHGDEVTTEPQRQALEAMSQDLINKLSAMVAEQERRAHEFAQQQHSLSSLPIQMLPEISAPEFPEVRVPEIEAAMPQLPPSPPGRTGSAGTAAAPKKRHESPHGARVPHGTTACSPPLPQSAKPKKYSWDTGDFNKMPTVIRDPKTVKNEGSIGAGTISFIIFIIFAIVLHGCD